MKTNSDGYVLIFDPGSDEARYGESADRGWGLLHRVLMARLLGRPLRPGENVHHVDGDRANNAVDGPLGKVEGRWRSGNLELWTTSQPAGQRMSDRIEHARDLLESNGYAVADS